MAYENEVRLRLITPGGIVPLTTRQLRRICENPDTKKFTLGGVTRRRVYDILAKCAGSWAVCEHEISKGQTWAGKTGAIWLIKRKQPASERGVLLMGLEAARKELDRAIDALLLDIRVEREQEEDEEGGVKHLSVEDLEPEPAIGDDDPEEEPDAGSFANLLGGRRG